MGRISLSLVVMAMAVCAQGCLEDLPVASRIDDLRVLAVRAEPPEVSPGATVTLDALVVDPRGSLGRTAKYSWYACVAPEQDRGFFGGGSETSTSGGRGNGLSDDPYGDSCILRYEAGERWAMKLGEGPTASLVVPSDLFDTQDALRIAYGLSEDLVIPPEIEAGFLNIAGLNYRVTLVVETDDGARIETQKRVNVSRDLQLANNRPNLNPAPPVLVLNEQTDPPAEVPPTVQTPELGRCLSPGGPPLAVGKAFTLTPTNFPDPAPVYLVLLAGTTTTDPFEIVERDEVLFYSFFSTDGALGKEQSKSSGEPASDWRLADVDEGPADLWVVVRDGRGGVSWCHEPLVIGR